MIDRSALPSISETLRRLGVEPKQRRSRCPVHRGDNPQALSFDDDKGQWFCFRCGKGGDVIALVIAALDTDFAGALRFFGLQPGKPPAPDPERIRQEQIRVGLLIWAKAEGRKLRDEFLTRERVLTKAWERLKRDPEDSLGWTWAAWALIGKDAIEYELDRIDIGTESQRLEAYLEWRTAA